jgi:hypothetical protein
MVPDTISPPVEYDEEEDEEYEDEIDDMETKSQGKNDQISPSQYQLHKIIA